MNDTELAGYLDRAAETIRSADAHGRANQEQIHAYVKSTHFMHAMSTAGLNTCHIMSLLSTQIELQMATLEMLNDIKQGLSRA